MTENAISTAIAEYNPIAAALAGVEKYRGLVVDVTTTKGMAEAKAAHKEVAALRIALEKTRKKVKEDVVARGKLIDGEANRIFAMIAAIEDPIKAQIEKQGRAEEEARKAAIRAEEERLARAEAERKAAEERRLAEERAKIEAEAKRLAEERARLEAEDRARRERAEAEDRERRRRMDEEEAARRKAIQEEEDRLRAARRAEEEKLAAERRAVEEAQRKQREDAEAKAAAERRAKEEAERAERLRQEAEQLAKDEAARKEREAWESAEREKLRAQQELADGHEMLNIWLQRFGHLEQFAEVAKEIKEFLEDAEVPA